MLGRSTWAGAQRFGGAVWSGDTQTTFDSLRTQFRTGLNMAMSGVSYWTTDIGGYCCASYTDPSFRRLIVRWFQWGAFCSLFRLHGFRAGPPLPGDGPPGACSTFFPGSGAANEVWAFGDEAYDAIRVVMLIREQLRPYIYEQYKKASADGTPLMRALWFDFPEDDVTRLIDDEMMFGPKYLLAPQLVENATSRRLYLPRLNSTTPTATARQQQEEEEEDDEAVAAASGGGGGGLSMNAGTGSGSGSVGVGHGMWRSWFSGEVFEGGQWIVVQTPMDTFPLFELLTD